MYNAEKKIEGNKKVKGRKREGKILYLAIMMFISFSLLNVFLIFNFINILSNIGTI